MAEPLVESDRGATAAATPAERDDLERLEIELLLEAIYRRYGFDFRQYAAASLKRRLWRRMAAFCRRARNCCRQRRLTPRAREAGIWWTVRRSSPAATCATPRQYPARIIQDHMR